MLKPNVEQGLNDQINAELYSAYLYLSMAAFFEARNLPGAANWMRIQAQEETVHAMKFFDYVNERGGRVTLTAIDAPGIEWESPLAVFEAAYGHEVMVSERINNLAALAQRENDFATRNVLDWFIAEQVEEEASADAIVQQLKLIAGSGEGLYMIDKELAARVFTPPPGEA